jgi:hypothetical protein
MAEVFQAVPAIGFNRIVSTRSPACAQQSRFCPDQSLPYHGTRHIILMLISCVCQLAGVCHDAEKSKHAGSSTPLVADNGNHWGCIVETGYS